MGLLTKMKQIGGGILDGVKTKVADTQANMDENAKLKDWQAKFLLAKKNYDLAIMDGRELQYLGTRELDPNVNKQIPAKKKANNIYNIIYEFIETQVDETIPMPNARSKRQGFEKQAQVIENCIKNDLTESEIYRINDENERTTPVQGFSIVNVNWNPDFKHHLYRGEIELDNPHPKCLVPQPGIYQIQKMDYYFLMFSHTKDYVKKRFKVEVENEVEQYPEINRLDPSDNPNNNTEKVTVITAVYKDENGDIGKFTWCNDIPLEDLPNIYARRLKRCTKCNEIMNGDVCTCGNKKSKESVEEYETLTTDIKRSDGSVIPAGTKIKYFTPTRYPIVIRKNVPIAFNFGGQSDVDIVRDQADAIKKVITRIEEKIINGTAIILLPDNKSVSISEEIFKVIRGTPADLAQVKALDIKADIQQDLQFAQEQYKIAQSMLGITDSYQGKADNTAKSGVAKQIQVNQSSGRMQSKVYNKGRSYKELFEIMFEFKLAFYDETRPYLAKDDTGSDVYEEFNKYDFLQQDDAGEWFYNTDFIITADAGDGIPKDKMWLFNNNLDMLRTGAYNPSPASVTFWSQMQVLKYPNATAIGKIIQDNWDWQIKNKSTMEIPKETINFKDLSPEGQVQMAAKLGIQLTQGTENMYNTMPIGNKPDNVPVQMPQDQQSIQPPQQWPQQGQQQPQHPADALFQALTPEQQKHLLSLPPDQQAAIIQKIIGGM